MDVPTARPSPFPLRRLVSYVLLAACTLAAMLGSTGPDRLPATSTTAHARSA